MQLSVPDDELIPLPQRGITLGGGEMGRGQTEHQIQPPAHTHRISPAKRVGAGPWQGQSVHTLSSPTFFDSVTATSVMCCSAVNMVNHRLPTLESLRPARARPCAATGEFSGKTAVAREKAASSPDSCHGSAGTHVEKIGSSAMPFTILRRSAARRGKRSIAQTKN